METSPIALQAAASAKAQLLLKENPDQRVYVIYDYETGYFDAATQDEIDYLQEIDYDFTVLHQAPDRFCP